MEIWKQDKLFWQQRVCVVVVGGGGGWQCWISMLIKRSVASLDVFINKDSTCFNFLVSSKALM